MARDPIVDKFDLTSVQIVFSGAGALGKELSDKFVERFPHISDLLQGAHVPNINIGHSRICGY